MYLLLPHKSISSANFGFSTKYFVSISLLKKDDDDELNQRKYMEKKKMGRKKVRKKIRHSLISVIGPKKLNKRKKMGQEVLHCLY